MQVLANLVAMEKAAEVCNKPRLSSGWAISWLIWGQAGASYYLTQNGTNESLALEAACVLVDDLEIRDERFYQKVRKQAKELKEKGQQVILLTNRPFTESFGR